MDRIRRPDIGDFDESHVGELLAAVHHDFLENPDHWDELWHDFAKTHPKIATKIIEQANRLINSGIDPKLAYMQGLFTPYAMQRKVQTAVVLAELLMPQGEEIVTSLTDSVIEPPNEAA